MKRVLITGITGYIGSNLARRLLHECKVYGLVRDGSNREYITDIQENLVLLPYDGSYESLEAIMRTAKPEVVYHLATYYTGSHGPTETPKLISSNITLGAYLLEAMVTYGVSKLVNTTTIMEHYHGACYCPLNLYAATKHAFSSLLEYYIDAGLINATTLAISDTYGPGDHRPKILNLIKKAAKSGVAIDLSEGSQDYDVVYIDDVIEAFALAANQSGNFQICAEHPLTLRETVEKMLEINNQTDWVPNWGARPAPERSIKKAVRIYPNVPQWFQKVPLQKGLREFWYDGQQKIY